MAANILSDEEYTFLANLEKDLLERAKTASPRASTHLRTAAKLHSDFLAREEGKRAAKSKKDTAKQEREVQKLQRQQERLTALQQKIQQPRSEAAGTGGQGRGSQRAQATA